LQQIHDYIARDNPGSASEVANRVIHSIAQLQDFPERGRPGRVEGTRELVLPPLPFVLVHEVLEEVRILRILHAAQRWPPTASR